MFTACSNVCMIEANKANAVFIQVMPSLFKSQQRHYVHDGILSITETKSSKIS